MSFSNDSVELKEEEITAHYAGALTMLTGVDHTPRIAKPVATPAAERSSGVPARRRFRSTTPGLVTRSTARPEGVHLIERIEAVTEDALVSQRQASVLQALRRGMAIGLALAENYAEATGLVALKKQNLDGALPAAKAGEFSALLTAESLITLYAFANATAFLVGGLADETTVDIGAIEEVLTENAPLALHGAVWELDQKLDSFATDEPRLVATILAYCELLMERVAARAQTATHLGAFEGNTYRIEADDMTIAGFTPSRQGKGTTLTMQFKKPHEVVGNHIAKYQAMKLAKMLMAYDFDRRLNPFAELGGFIFTFMGDGAPGTGKTTLIQMMAGMVNDYCQVAGYPFRYQNFGIDNIDSYQGKSGQNAKAFINNVIDPHVIGFGTIDDIDQIAGKRGDR
jgi:hypothetical protein